LVDVNNVLFVQLAGSMHRKGTSFHVHSLSLRLGE